MQIGRKISRRIIMIVENCCLHPAAVFCVSEM